MPLAPKSVRLDELAKLHQLKEQGALTDEEFDREKAKLLPDETAAAPPADGSSRIALWVLAGSAVILILVVIAAFVIFGSRGAPTPAATSTTTSTLVTNTTEVASPSAVPATFTPDQLATAFATVYPHGAREPDASGEALEFTPRKLLSVQGETLALVSTALRDGGMKGAASHASAGGLRIDYLDWNGGQFAYAQSGGRRFDEPGQGFGEPPSWHVITRGTGFPVIKVEVATTNQGCTSSSSALLKLTPAGVVRTNGTSKEDCSGATTAPPEGS